MNKLSSLAVALGFTFLSLAGWSTSYPVTICNKNLTNLQATYYVYGSQTTGPSFGDILSGTGFTCNNANISAVPGQYLAVDLGKVQIGSDYYDCFINVSGNGLTGISYIPPQTTKIEFTSRNQSTPRCRVTLYNGTTNIGQNW